MMCVILFLLNILSPSQLLHLLCKRRVLLPVGREISQLHLRVHECVSEEQLVQVNVALMFGGRLSRRLIH